MRPDLYGRGGGNAGLAEGERAALLRYFLRRTGGDRGAAEDLTQETALAFLSRPAGATPRGAGDARAYLYGIARRLYGRWAARHREEAFREQPFDEAPLPPVAPGEEESDPLASLLRAEREALVERALGRVRPSARALLSARYLDDLPLPEIARRIGASENAAAVRLHRSREALRAVLATALRAEAAAHGLLPDAAAEGWRETSIPCCRCGRARMLGRFEAAEGEFALRCPACADLVGQSSQAAPMDGARVLAGVSGFRAGLNRVNGWWQGYVADALRRGVAPCVRCSRTAAVRVDRRHAGFGTDCPACAATTFFIRPTGLLYHADAAQAFWRRHPRMRNLPERPVVCEGRPAVAAAFEDAGATSARVEMVFDAETLACLRVATAGGAHEN